VQAARISPDDPRRRPGVGPPAAALVSGLGPTTRWPRWGVRHRLQAVSGRLQLDPSGRLWHDRYPLTPTLHAVPFEADQTAQVLPDPGMAVVPIVAIHGAQVPLGQGCCGWRRGRVGLASAKHAAPAPSGARTRAGRILADQPRVRFHAVVCPCGVPDTHHRHRGLRLLRPAVAFGVDWLLWGCRRVGVYRSSPSWPARVTAWVRLATPSLSKMWVTWLLTVARVTTSSSAIAWLELPAASN
jgi:hypothetical protein